MRNELQAALEDAILYHELQAKSIQEAIGKTNHPRAVELYEDAKRYNETALTALRGPEPDPDTGLVPCGCGGKAKVWPSDLRQAMVTAYQVGCIKCAMTTVWVRGKQENAMNVWNTAMGYTAPSLPRAIGPDAGDMDPNGEEGEEL